MFSLHQPIQLLLFLIPIVKVQVFIQLIAVCKGHLKIIGNLVFELRREALVKLDEHVEHHQVQQKEDYRRNQIERDFSDLNSGESIFFAIFLLKLIDLHGSKYELLDCQR